MKWPERSIVIYCGRSFATWGPETLKEGMGGSEEAVVYLARELCRNGFAVTVFNDRSVIIEDIFGRPDDQVIWPVYRPWNDLDVNDEFDVFIGWRNPTFLEGISARKRFCDLHDFLAPESVYDELKVVDRFCFKSHFHRMWYPQVPEVQSAEIGNGIYPTRLANRSSTRAPLRRYHSVGYFSGYYRGLDCLLRMWPAVRKRVPDATLDIYYGWQGWHSLGGGNEELEDQLRQLQREILALLTQLKSHGVNEHGRVSHEDLTDAMQHIEVWAYPTEFGETFCITALKAQDAGCFPVVTNVGALEETVQRGFKLDCLNIYSNAEAQAAFIEAVVSALQNPVQVEPLNGVAWSDVAANWIALFND